jgi:hypothetical protein
LWFEKWFFLSVCFLCNVSDAWKSVNKFSEMFIVVIKSCLFVSSKEKQRNCNKGFSLEINTGEAKYTFMSGHWNGE